MARKKVTVRDLADPAFTPPEPGKRVVVAEGDCVIVASPTDAERLRDAIRAEARSVATVSENEVAMFRETASAGIVNEYAGRHTSKSLELIEAGYRRGIEDTLKFLVNEGRLVVLE